MKTYCDQENGCMFCDLLLCDGKPRKDETMITEQEIKEWFNTHDTKGMSEKDIIKAIMLEALQNTKHAEEHYPGLKDKPLNEIKNA